MLNEVLERIKEIMEIAQATLLADGALILTLAEAPPRGAQEFEKFVGAIGMRPTTFNQTRKPNGEPNEKIVALSYPIDVFGQPFKIDYDVRMYTGILTVADAIVDEFNERLLLQDSSGVPLRFLDATTPIIITGGTVIKEQYPGTPGNVAAADDIRYHFSANVNVSYLWTCPSKSA